MENLFSAQMVVKDDATPSAISGLRSHLRKQGLTVGPMIAGNFSISGPGSLFHSLLGESHDRSSDTDRDLIDVSSGFDGQLFLASLAPEWTDIIHSAVITRPPDFGPGNP